MSRVIDDDERLQPVAGLGVVVEDDPAQDVEAALRAEWVAHSIPMSSRSCAHTDRWVSFEAQSARSRGIKPKAPSVSV